MAVPRTGTRAGQTRENLIRAAIEVFGRDGFHAGSTRAIGEAAGVNQALIAYHFGGKSGLYRAAIESITDTLAASMGPLLAEIEAALARRQGDSPANRAVCLDFLDRMLAGTIDLFGQPEAGRWVKLVTREQQDPTEAFDIFYQGIYREMLEVFTTLVARVTGEAPDTAATRVLALTLLGQIMIFVVGRATMRRHVGWAELGEPERRILHAQVRAGLFARFGNRETA